MFSQDYHKFFFGDYSGIWQVGSQICIGLNEASKLGIDYTQWPNGRQIIKGLYFTAGRVADQWYPLPKKTKYQNIWNCIQVNLGYNGRTRGNIWAPQFHLDNQPLYTTLIDKIKVYNGIVAITLDGSNGFCLNKKYWLNQLNNIKNENIACNIDNFKIYPKIWAQKLCKWGWAKQPGSVYGVFGLATFLWQHAVMTGKSLKLIMKEYNEIMKQYGYEDLMLTPNMFEQDTVTAIFRSMDLNNVSS